MSESPTPPVEVPAPEVPPESLQTAQQINAPQTGVVELPPAAALVTGGEVTDERALAIERREREAAEREARLRDTETAVSERERKIQEREAALADVPNPKPQKVKRKPGWTDPVFSEEGDNE